MMPATQSGRTVPAIGARPVRVAHITLSLRTGGLERFICNLIATKENAAVRTLVICLDEEGELAETARAAGARIVLIKRKPGFDFGLVFRLARLLREERIDAIHTHSLDPMIYGGLAARLAGLRARVHTHHNTMLESSGRWERWKFRMACRLFTQLVAVSEQTRRGMLAAGAPADRTVTILNGIEAGEFIRSDIRHTGELVIGTVARLSREKGLDRLLRAFARLETGNRGLRLRLAGDGPERGALEQLAGELGIADRVEFLGFSRDVAGVLAGFDVYALPSLTEGIPIALLEAMAAGLPIVASRVGGVPEVIVDGDSGLLVPPGDVDALTAALTVAVGDEGRRRGLGAQARTRVETVFSLTAMARRYRPLYDDNQRIGWREGVKRLLRLAPHSLIRWNAKGARAAAITFDDGPDPVHTPRVLEILSRYGVKATFFLLGENIAIAPDVARRIAAEGHEIANHSYTHPDLDRLSWREALEEARRTQEALDTIAPRQPRLFRPPKGRICMASFLIALRHRMPIVLWTVDPKDFRAHSAAEITSDVRVRPGDVILYHGITEASVEALPRVIETAMAGAGKLVTVTELFRKERA